mmetsp:Transcript_7255/g.11835  ORF Transcript_7255/g.11835 Transcript_7255/m.11835 type:complete len:374 (+) Transcript_7255:74-1195(+)
MGWLHDYEDVNRFSSPRSVEQGKRQRCKMPGRFQPAPSNPILLGSSDSVRKDVASSPRTTTKLEAGSPSRKTAALANHCSTPRGPVRASPHIMDEYVCSPRRQLRRGDSCPPERTDPITHTSSLRTDPLALRCLEYGHLATRQRSLRRCGYPKRYTSGKLDLKTHVESAEQILQQGHSLKTSSFALNSSNLAGEEDLLPASTRILASDAPSSARYAKVIEQRDLTYIDRGGCKASNPSLLTSGDMLQCLNLSGFCEQQSVGDEVQIPSVQPVSEPPEQLQLSEPLEPHHVGECNHSLRTDDESGRPLERAAPPPIRTSGSHPGSKPSTPAPSVQSSLPGTPRSTQSGGKMKKSAKVDDRIGRPLKLFQDPLRA